MGDHQAVKKESAGTQHQVLDVFGEKYELSADILKKAI
jgi:hypothetical protein